MRRQDLAVAILEDVRVRAVQHARSAAHKRRRVLAGPDPLAGRLDPDQHDVAVVEEGGEHADRIGAPAHAGDDDVGKLAVEREVLLARLVADHALQVAHHLGIWVWADDRADDVVGGADVGHPVPDRLGGRVLEGPRP